jgi:hypothetical protein
MRDRGRVYPDGRSVAVSDMTYDELIEALRDVKSGALVMGDDPQAIIERLEIEFVIRALDGQ